LAGDDVANRRRLPARTLTYWRWRAVFTGVPVLALVVLGAVFLDWPATWLRWTIAGATAVWLLVALTVAPPIRRRIFWYAVDADEIDIERGLVVVSRSVVPMTRVQHLKTERGPLADRFRLASLHIHTAGGTVSIHAIDSADADSLRVRITEWANLADDV
jgi:membrane protein YdbS with pleckstrin-like domain